MTLKYGFVKCTLKTDPKLQSSGGHNGDETQYHLHSTLDVDGEDWDTAINVGTDDSDDLLKYIFVFDFHHDVIQTLSTTPAGFNDLTGTSALPALDFLRSDLLKETGPWRDSGIMDGSDTPEPVASLKRLSTKARASGATVYIFGRTYTHGGNGIHDIHMNQGSNSNHFWNKGDDHNDHNDIWQDGGVLVDFGTPKWAAYFTAFTQQVVPTDDSGNPVQQHHPIQDSDNGSMIAG